MYATSWFDFYQAETERLASEQSAMMDEARQKLQALQTLTALEQAGILYALQILIENAIGIAKHILKATKNLFWFPLMVPSPVSSASG